MQKRWYRRVVTATVDGEVVDTAYLYGEAKHLNGMQDRAIWRIREEFPKAEIEVRMIP